MCRIENNYIPPSPERFDLLISYIGKQVEVQYRNEASDDEILSGVFEDISTHHQSEYVKINGQEIRLDRVVTVHQS